MQRRIRINADEKPLSAYREFWQPFPAPAGKLLNLRLNYAFECDSPLTIGQRVDLISPGNLVTPVRIIGANDKKFIATDCTSIRAAAVLKLVAVVAILGAIAVLIFARPLRCSYPGCTAKGELYYSEHNSMFEAAVLSEPGNTRAFRYCDEHARLVLGVQVR